MESITIQYATDDPAPPENDLREWCQHTLTQQERCGELTIRIVNRAEMASLNENFRGKSGPTNVLSFPAQLPAGITHELLGDIVICAQIVNQEAAAQHKQNEAHWAHMVVHGTLHILGYDHKQEEEANEMETIEITLLNQLGFANPYDTTANEVKE